MTGRHWITLSDAELALLHGKVEDVQAECVVVAAIARLAMIAAHPGVPVHIAELAADIVTSAKSEQQLGGGPTSSRSCNRCGADAGFHLYTKNGLRPKGSPNLQRPKSMACFKSGGVSSCMACWLAAKPIVLESLRHVQVEIHKVISGVDPMYRRIQNVRCLGDMCGVVGRPLGDRTSFYSPYHLSCSKCRGDAQSTGTYTIVNVHAEAAIDSLAAMAQ